jgi:hypothetical protein
MWLRAAFCRRMRDACRALLRRSSESPALSGSTLRAGDGALTAGDSGRLMACSRNGPRGTGGAEALGARSYRVSSSLHRQ